MTAVLYLRFSPSYHIQPVYNDIVYSPFLGIDPILFNRIEVSVSVDDDDFNYAVSVCQIECPVMTRNKSFAVNPSCNTGRTTVNCYAKVNPDSLGTTEARDNSEYMLKNSQVLIKIMESNAMSESVNVCVTVDKDKCYQVFMSKNSSTSELKNVCHELMTFNETNNFTATFVAHVDSYFCFVWILKDKHQWINYTTNSIIQMYNISDFNSSQSCRVFPVPKIKQFTYSFHIGRKPWNRVCAVIQATKANGYYFGPNITITSGELKRLAQGSAKAGSAVMGLLIITCFVVSVIFCLCACRNSYIAR